ncbi:unnamed protein product, partial [marine sediment metagenome]
IPGLDTLGLYHRSEFQRDLGEDGDVLLDGLRGDTARKEEVEFDDRVSGIINVCSAKSCASVPIVDYGERDLVIDSPSGEEKERCITGPDPEGSPILVACSCTPSFVELLPLGRVAENLRPDGSPR